MCWQSRIISFEGYFGLKTKSLNKKRKYYRGHPFIERFNLLIFDNKKYPVRNTYCIKTNIEMTPLDTF